MENLIATSNDSTVHFDDLYRFSEMWFHAASTVMFIGRNIFWRVFLRSLKPGGVIFLFGGTKNLSKLACYAGSQV
jgi:hypothetical protein